jgi:hypothetical protein
MINRKQLVYLFTMFMMLSISGSIVSIGFGFPEVNPYPLPGDSSGSGSR